MQLKSKIALLAVLPLVLVALSVTAIIAIQAHRLATEQTAAIDRGLLQVKRTELKHYVELALTAINPLYASGHDDLETQSKAKAILDQLSYGDDGYFFVYDLHGRNLVHPRLPAIVGLNLWGLRDPHGLPVIQRLIEVARRGGGYQEYEWQKPSTGQMTEKLGYVVPLPRWGWVIGTGVYLDDVAHISDGVRAHVAVNIKTTMQQVAALGLFAVLIVACGGAALNISAHRLANRSLKTLAQRIVGLQEEERSRVSRDLHDGISQLLASTKYQFELAQHQIKTGNGDPAPALARGLSGVSEAIGEVRRISHDLHPLLLDQLGLVPAITQLARDFNERTGIEITTSISQNLSNPLAPIALTLFRITQESLTNIERHSEARHARIELDRVVGMMKLVIADDGHGFDATSLDTRSGLGLRNILERVEYQGGQMKVISGSNGTLVAVQLPTLEGTSA